MKIRRVSDGSALIAAVLLPLSPAVAARTIQIDVASQRNELGSCGSGGFANCLYFNRAFGASVVGVRISQNGYVQLMDGRAGSMNLFSIGRSDALYTVLSGYTGTLTNNRIDFIDFYRPGRDLTPNSAGNRPTPDFQIQLRNLAGRNGLTDLEVAFAYWDNGLITADATIGYSGTTFSQTGPSLISSRRGPAERFITNSGGLLLGTQPTDSDFAFVVGDYLLVQNGTGQGITMGIVSETFEPRYAASGDVPEPATWGMMVLGFGMAGVSLRRRHRVKNATV
jgi:hypothetical protein